MNLMKYKIVPIAGDASFRKFYRLISKKNNKILVVAEKQKYQNLFVYCSINNFLKSNKIFTPKLYEYNYTKSMIIIEDFGDLSFYKILLKTNNKLKIYKKLIDLLLKIQKIKPKSKIKNINNKPYFIDKYSIKLLHKESDLFFDWYLPLFIKKKKNTIIKKKLKNILSKLYKKIYFSNSCFVHRDYHSQNLMKVKNKIGVIDTQDALIGNPVYDLVSLIDDARIKTSEKLKNKVYNYFLEKKYNTYKKVSDKVLSDFNILSIQRSLKIIGIFSRLFKRDKKLQYLKHIPYVWKLLETRMKSEMFIDLKKVLDDNISKKIRKKTSF